MAKADIRSLTGLRGVAALWVAAYHLLLPGGIVTGAAAGILGRGYLAVDVFFILSGFVLALNYGDRFAGPHPIRALPGFLWRRWARIFPLYGLILVTRLAYTAARYGGFALPRPWIAAPLPHPWLDIPANLLLVQSWGLTPSVIGPAWSVSTEWGAYWLFPLLAAVMLHRHASWALAGAIAASGCVLAADLAHGGLDCWDGQTLGPMLRCVGGFTLGVGLWRLSQCPAAARLAASPATGWAVCATLAAGLAIGAPDLILYAAFPALVLCLACNQLAVGGIFATRLAVWLGEISYALYLLHIFLLHPLDQARAALGLLLPPPAAGIAAALALLAFALAAAEVAHRLVERPARAWLAVTLPAVWAPAGSRLRTSLTRPTPDPRNLPPPGQRSFPPAPENVTLRTAR
jgi:peptidoglycan/LPS O-acetylase OafA/YrhL